MQKRKTENNKEVMSMEEYITKRKEMQEEKRKRGIYQEEKSPAWMLAELYG